jgi:hypothetical protein
MDEIWAALAATRAALARSCRVWSGSEIATRTSTD